MNDLVFRSMEDLDAEALQDALPEGWSLFDPDDPFAGFVCPHDYAIEPDGECPEGCESPFVSEGVI